MPRMWKHTTIKRRSKMSVQTKLADGWHSYTTFNEPPIVDCPFCLYRGKLTDFYIRIKGTIKEPRKYSEKQLECPDCLNKYRKTTLQTTTNMTPQQYGAWIYNQRTWDSKLHPRIKWDKLKTRLGAIGARTQFWQGYYNEKEKDPRWKEFKEQHSELYVDSDIAKMYHDYQEAETEKEQDAAP